jgi:hypothetical protein
MPNVMSYVPTFEERVFHAAVDYLGFPYEQFGDNDKFDCSQLVVNVFRLVGFNLPDMRAADFYDQLFTLPQPPETGPKVGAIFRREEGEIVHIGLIGPSGTIVVHATLRDGRVVVKSLDQVEYSDIRFLDCAKLLEYMGKNFGKPSPIDLPRKPGGA